MLRGLCGDDHSMYLLRAPPKGFIHRFWPLPAVSAIRLPFPFQCVADGAEILQEKLAECRKYIFLHLVIGGEHLALWDDNKRYLSLHGIFSALCTLVCTRIGTVTARFSLCVSCGLCVLTVSIFFLISWVYTERWIFWVNSASKVIYVFVYLEVGPDF